ncbi:MAG TPA: PilT/PilU family type 4a pilus ATPase [Vicinamibacterales bacterium]|nr:PilT/PilU family type 4a pilus ATPase [Vicinamibacterales bacterium]
MDSTDRLEQWLRTLVSQSAADLFLVAGAAPAIRLNGVVTPLPEAPLEGEAIEAAVLPALHPHAVERYRNEGSADVSLRRAALGRFRVNLHRERGRAAATIRALPAKPPLLSELGLPSQVEQITRLHHGLVLVGGATGSGKTTTVAALVNEINRRDAKHIITIEDPIEYEHAHQKSVIEQVEIGIDAPDFPTALRAALRQAPDVIVIGEMRDPETMKIALTAGETGHLVLSTLHTTDVTSTVARVADSFPSERQATIRQDLSMALGAVLTQTLIPRAGSSAALAAGGSTALTASGRVPACELLMIGYGARQHIRKNALQHLHQEITMTKRSGSLTLEESLAQLVHKGLISTDEARSRTAHAEELEGLLRH